MRAVFFLSICRFAITAMCEKDRDWANSLQAIKPGIILMGDTLRRKALGLGSTQLRYRFKAAVFFAIPHLIAEFQECELVKYKGFAPTVENLAVLAKERMKWHSERDGTSTIKGRIWGPSPSGGTCRSHVVSGRIRQGILHYGKSEIVVALSEGSSASPTRACCIGVCPRRLLPRVKQFKSKKQIRLSFPLSYPFDPFP